MSFLELVADPATSEKAPMTMTLSTLLPPEILADYWHY